MITVLLDGYNVIYAVPELARHMDHSLQSAREALVALCQEHRARRGDVRRLYVVFDGRDIDAPGSHAQSRGDVAVLFTRKPEEADERIVRLIEAERGRCVVVSNDNELCNNARAFRAGVLSAQEFYAQARPASARQPAPPTIPGKAILPSHAAQRITEEYRKHLEGKTKKKT